MNTKETNKLFKEMKKQGRLAKFFKKNKKKRNLKSRNDNEKTLAVFGLVGLVVLIFVLLCQVFSFAGNLIQIEAFESYQKVSAEVSGLERHVIYIEGEIDGSLKSSKWDSVENRKKIAKQVRHLNVLNSHLTKTIEAHDNDFSLKVYKGSLVDLEKIFRETRNIQIISERIANKVDTLLLFETVSEDQKTLLEKDLDLFYEKVDLVYSLGFGGSSD